MVCLFGACQHHHDHHSTALFMGGDTTSKLKIAFVCVRVYFRVAPILIILEGQTNTGDLKHYQNELPRQSNKAFNLLGREAWARRSPDTIWTTVLALARQPLEAGQERDDWVHTGS